MYGAVFVSKLNVWLDIIIYIIFLKRNNKRMVCSFIFIVLLITSNHELFYESEHAIFCLKHLLYHNHFQFEDNMHGHNNCLSIQ